MGCNCKKPVVLNNLKSQDHLKVAEEIYYSIIKDRDISEYTDLDKLEIFNTHRLLYPNASQTPSLEQAIELITNSLQYIKKPRR